MDFQAYLQRELLTPLGIEPGSWRWGRDSAGHTQGFFDLHMTPNDYARLGELLRRGGVWRGRRLLARRAVKAAITPTKTNGCYGWMIWLNRAKPCVGPRVSERPVDNHREFPELPVDLYHFSGLFGQLVAVFPSQKIIVVRLGQEANPGGFAGGADYQNELFKRVLGAVTDQRIPRPGGGEDVPGVSRHDLDRGFQTAIHDPDTYSGGMNPPPLPPAGPRRARAIILEKASRRVRPGAVVPVAVHCPRFRLRGESRRRVLAGRRFRGKAVGLAPDAADGTRSTLPLVLRPPRA
jgi:CubicO group peptidase (beta-lactamase class C family)